MKTYIYRRPNENVSVFKDTVIKINENNISQIIVYTENERDRSVYNSMKTEMENRSTLIISDISALGSDYPRIVTELSWLKDRCIQLIVINIPSTLLFIDIQNSSLALSILMDVFSLCKSNPYKQNADSRQNVGRKKAVYPENWDELYAKWERKEITPAAFLKASGLKKATFYNLLGEYRMGKENYRKVYSVSELTG